MEKGQMKTSHADIYVASCSFILPNASHVHARVWLRAASLADKKEGKQFGRERTS